MKAPSAFRATYADWKLIKTRSCIQVVFELPLEAANEAYEALGGMPNPATESWFGIARLDLSKVSGVATLEGSANAPAVRKVVAPENRMKTRCAITCGSSLFWQFLNETYGGRFPQANVTDEEGAAALVRFLCDVSSRSEIMPDTRAGKEWDALLAAFTIWEQADQYVEEPA